MHLSKLTPELLHILIHTFPNYRGRKWEIQEMPEHMGINSYWDGGSRRYYALFDLSSNKSINMGDSHPFFDRTGNLVLIRDTCPINMILVENNIVQGKDHGIIFYIKPENLQKMLPEKTNVQITWAEKVVLVATRSLKPSYRIGNAMQDTGITAKEYMEGKESLIMKGLLDKRGAMTIDGKNLVASFGWQDLYVLRKER